SLQASILAPPEKNTTALLADSEVAIYPHLELIGKVDSSGMQTAKATVQMSTTPFVTIADRRYFQLARDGLLWKASDGVDLLDTGRVVESIRSKGNNQEYAILARRLRTPTRDCSVVLIESRMLSVFDAVLPPETGFAI